MGVLMGVSGIGSFIGSLGLLSIPHGHRATALKGAGAAIALGLAGLSAARNLNMACPALVSLALGLSMTFGLANTVIQERAPNHLRGRVSAVAGMSFFGLSPFSGLLVSAGRGPPRDANCDAERSRSFRSQRGLAAGRSEAIGFGPERAAGGST